MKNLCRSTIDATVSEMDSIADGGAALTAYGKLQYTDMPLQGTPGAQKFPAEVL